MLKKFMDLTLQIKLMLFFSAISLIPLLFLGTFTYQLSSRMVKEEASRGVMEQLAQVNKNLAFFSRDIEQLSHYIYRSEIVHEVLEKQENRSSLEKYQDFKRIEELFDIVLGSKTWNVNLYIVGFNGDRYFTGDYLPPQYSDVKTNWGIFRKAEAAKGAVAWDTHYTIRHTNTQEVVLSVGRLIKKPKNNETIGYSMIPANMQVLMDEAFLDYYRFYEGYQSILLKSTHAKGMPLNKVDEQNWLEFLRMNENPK